MTKTYVGPPSPSPWSVSFQHLPASQRSNSCFKETWPVSSKVEERAASFLTSPQQGHSTLCEASETDDAQQPMGFGEFQMGSGCTQWLGTNNNSRSVCELYSDPVSSNYISFHLYNDFIAWAPLKSTFYRRGNWSPERRGNWRRRRTGGSGSRAFPFQVGYYFARTAQPCCLIWLLWHV